MRLEMTYLIVAMSACGSIHSESQLPLGESLPRLHNWCMGVGITRTRPSSILTQPGCQCVDYLQDILRVC
ncbi:hypothetical protein K439DRAFT_555567 [Ramaria rubella]|nr:hypothetical protein K439DRAFT_555567 [Ramaria rubella]